MKETFCVHSSRNDRGVNTPIYPSTSNRYLGYESNIYPRYFNTPNQEVIVEKLCELEGAEDGVIFSSGMAAISTSLISNLNPGDHVIFSKEIYGGTFKLITEEFSKYGIEYDFTTEEGVQGFEAKKKANTKAIYTETPSNPLLTIVDLRELSDFATHHELLSFVDNTFATPILQNPIELGFDIVLHSGTKYLGGHSDLCFGAVLTNKKICDNIRNRALNHGGSLNALDCYLIERSIKTLAVRVENHSNNAQYMAEYLNQLKTVSKVFYPGLPEHPNHKIAKSQMREGFGGMLAFELSDQNVTETFLSNLSLIAPSLSLGGVETTICQPSKTSHVKMGEKDRLKLGITDSLLRLSVGIENVVDLTKDIDQALTKSV